MLEMIRLQKKHLGILLKWRTQAYIQEVMLTEVSKSFDDQLKWFDTIIKDKTKKYWIIRFNNVLIGVVNLDKIDMSAKKCTAGFYIGEQSYSSLGAIVLPCLYNFVFKKLKLKKIYGSVVSSNEKILKIHRLHGYKQVGFSEKILLKGDKYLDIIHIELVADEWLKMKKYSNYKSEWQ